MKSCLEIVRYIKRFIIRSIGRLFTQLSPYISKVLVSSGLRGCIRFRAHLQMRFNSLIMKEKYFLMNVKQRKMIMPKRAH